MDDYDDDFEAYDDDFEDDEPSPAPTPKKSAPSKPAPPPKAAPSKPEGTPAPKPSAAPAIPPTVKAPAGTRTRQNPPSAAQANKKIGALRAAAWARARAHADRASPDRRPERARSAERHGKGKRSRHVGQERERSRRDPLGQQPAFQPDEGVLRQLRARTGRECAHIKGRFAPQKGGPAAGAQASPQGAASMQAHAPCMDAHALHTHIRVHAHTHSRAFLHACTRADTQTRTRLRRSP